MAAFTPRRRKTAKTLRNLAIAEAALAFVKDRALAKLGRRRSRRPSGKLLVGIGAGAAAVAAGVAGFLGREKVAHRLPSRSPSPTPPPAPAPPQPSNYDAPGPAVNTATPIPAPDPHGEPPATIDEAAEEAAAASEAGAIGGDPSGYAGSEPGEAADEPSRPLAEGGGGESEGQEQTEAGLAESTTHGDGGTGADAPEGFLPPAAPAEPAKGDDNPEDSRTWSGRSADS
jgi:predicted lipid-binding transport protein (Tim44 family)